ncbi:hypothetical protein NIES2100_00460 [Calothrix sp. NIES-2100]|uniref:DUF6888 family protein n=1 Tax=Calothrix sp. NIES-2100 TaxID=1954172 RepID=UPI000B6230CB|nr:hypothetical protein NIES2100_00460 [Calothrix sp. NIES-2100]
MVSNWQQGALKDMPTPEQIEVCFILSYRLTQMYVPIYLVTVNSRTKDVFILAGEETEIIINTNGYWRYL